MRDCSVPVALDSASVRPGHLGQAQPLPDHSSIPMKNRGLHILVWFGHSEASGWRDLAYGL